MFGMSAFSGGTMASYLDPNVLSPFQLIDPGTSVLISTVVTSVSVAMALSVAIHFFRSYRFSGFGYLLGLPVGFVLLACSFVFQHLSLLYDHNLFLHPAFFWIQVVLQSEGFALIAISYRFKDFESIHSHPPKSAAVVRPVQIRHVVLSIAPIAMVTVPFLVPTSLLAISPYFNYAKFADLSFCMMLFNLAVIAYIFKSTIVSLVKSANPKLLYVPAAFALFFIEQYSLAVTYFDNSVSASVGSLIARIAALSLFVYMIYRVTSLRRKLEVEAREKA